MIALIAAGLLLQASSEWLAQPDEPELKLGYSAEQGPMRIEERVPHAETVEDWSRMITTQRFADVVATGMNSEAFAGRMAMLWHNSCPASPARPTPAPGGALRFDCPRNPQTGKPETMFLRAFTGSKDMYVLQIAFRHVPTSRETAWATHHLGAAALCTPGAAAATCRANPSIH